MLRFIILFTLPLLFLSANTKISFSENEDQLELLFNFSKNIKPKVTKIPLERKLHIFLNKTSFDKIRQFRPKHKSIKKILVYPKNGGIIVSIIPIGDYKVELINNKQQLKIQIIFNTKNNTTAKPDKNLAPQIINNFEKIEKINTSKKKPEKPEKIDTSKAKQSKILETQKKTNTLDKQTNNHQNKQKQQTKPVITQNTNTMDANTSEVPTKKLLGQEVIDLNNEYIFATAFTAVMLALLVLIKIILNNKRNLQADLGQIAFEKSIDKESKVMVFEFQDANYLIFSNQTGNLLLDKFSNKKIIKD